MRAWLGRRIWDVRFSTAEARSRSRLQDAGNLDEGRARLHVGMVLRFSQGQHRRDAGILSFEQAGPFVARSRLECRLEAPSQLRPALTVMLIRQGFVFQP